ncbi:uncharacterized protein LOC143438662 [Arvicanthis niloticus]|uniref:uncharacterized protein LOC143310564 n=1 Tax=Arvicanthis niloticus TaxID=61156 RepID=UPI00402BCEB4
MGHSLSKEASFIKDLKQSLRERGIRVKKKDLIDFFVFIDEQCPWFMLDGPIIHPKKWQKVGRELNEKIKCEGDGAVIPTIFSFWGIIRDIIEDADKDSGKRQLFLVAEYCLSQSCPGSAGSSCLPSQASVPFTLIDMPHESQLPSSSDSPHIYPDLSALDSSPMALPVHPCHSSVPAAPLPPQYVPLAIGDPYIPHSQTSYCNPVLWKPLLLCPPYAASRYLSPSPSLAATSTCSCMQRFCSSSCSHDRRSGAQRFCSPNSRRNGSFSALPATTSASSASTLPAQPLPSQPLLQWAAILLFQRFQP